MKKRDNKKRIGIWMLILTSVLLAWIIVSSAGIILVGIGAGVDIFGLLPFLGLTIFKLVILLFAFLMSIRLVKGKSLPFNFLGGMIIAIGVAYFAYDFIFFLYDNITGMNPGAWLQPILAFLWGVVLVLVGVAIKKSK